jgi:hypothetical protein
MSDSQKKGIGGWLILVIIGLIINVISMVASFDIPRRIFRPDNWHAATTFGSGYYHPLFATWAIYDVIYFSFFILFDLFLLVLMFKKSRSFPKMMIVFFILAIITQVIDYMLTNSVLTDLPIVAKQMGYYPSLKYTISAIVQALIWIPYFMKSKRVKETFLSNAQTTNTFETKSI